MKKNKFKKYNKSGMSFVEAIIGIFIFAVIMFSVTMIFTSSFGGYKKADNMAKNIEDAQYMMNIMAKTLRTSKILSCDPVCNAAAPSTTTKIRFYNYSEKKCGRYDFDSTSKKLNIYAANDAESTSTECSNYLDNEFSIDGSLPTNSLNLKFAVVKSYKDATTPSNNRMGKVTISMKVCSSPTCATGGKNDQVILQTTVSLRDYSTVEL